MKRLILTVCFVSLLGGVAFADDRDDILALIDEYSRLQGTDNDTATNEYAASFVPIMSEDRIYIGGGI